MDARSEIEGIVGVKVGPKRTIQPMLEAIKAKGVLGVAPSFVAALRAGRKSGEKTKWRLESAEVQNASKKNQVYTNICTVALNERTFNDAPIRVHLFKSTGYTENVARLLSMDPYVLERLIRAMRADMVLAQTESPDTVLANEFNKIAERYLKDRLKLPPSMKPAGLTALDGSWNHRTMESFYKNFYNFLGVRVIGTWTPYEMEGLSLFYRNQIEAGNLLTPFDRMVIDAHKKGVLITGKVAQQIRESTGIEVDHDVLIRHRNLLAYGVSSHNK